MAAETRDAKPTGDMLENLYQMHKTTWGRQEAPGERGGGEPREETAGEGRGTGADTIRSTHYSPTSSSQEASNAATDSSKAEIQALATQKQSERRRKFAPECPRYTCSPWFRRVALDTFPALRHDAAFRRYMGFLLFTSMRDSKTDYIITPASIIADCEGKLRQNLSGNHPTYPFLKRFRKEVLPAFEWTNHGEGCPRRVRHLGLPDDFARALDIELLTYTPAPNRVYFDTGEPRSTRRRHKDRERSAKYVRDVCNSVAEHPAEPVLKYMNSRSPHSFARTVTRNLKEAHELAAALSRSGKRNSALRTLRSIEEQPQPLYTPTSLGRSVRLICPFDSMLNLQKDVRRVLTQDWAEFDLRNSQLAICSKLWEVDKVRHTLRTRGSIWGPLMEYLGVEPGSQPAAILKPMLKEAMYAAQYGGDVRYIEYMIRSGIDALDLAASIGVSPQWAKNLPYRFIDFHVIAAMLEAREEQLAKIRKDRGALDCFNQWIPITQEKGDKSVLAIQAQAVELALLLPVFDVVSSSGDECQIMLWQHDGFSVSFRSEEKRERWTQRIVAAVNEEAERWGVPTELEVEHSHLVERSRSYRLAA